MKKRLCLPSDIVHDPKIRKRPVCGVMATAIAAGITFTEAFNYYKNLYSKKNRRFKGPLYDYEYITAMKHFGVRVEELNEEIKNLFIDYPISKFIAHIGLLDPDNVYLVITKNHVQLVYNGLVTDQGGTTPTKLYCHRLRKVKRILKLNSSNFKFETFDNI